MSERIKYIILNDEIPILFPDFVNHSYMAERFSCDKITSAGFVQLVVEKVKITLGTKICDYDQITPHAYGESVTLKLKSNPERDSNLMKFMFRKEY